MRRGYAWRPIIWYFACDASCRGGSRHGFAPQPSQMTPGAFGREAARGKEMSGLILHLGDRYRCGPQNVVADRVAVADDADDAAVVGTICGGHGADGFVLQRVE